MTQPTQGQGGPKENVSFYLKKEDVQRINALVPKLSTEWLPMDRSQVVRALIVSGLENFEPLNEARKKAQQKPRSAKRKAPKRKRSNDHRA